MVNLSVSANIKFDTLEEARRVGQAVELLLGKEAVFKLTDFVEGNSGGKTAVKHPLHPPVPNTNIVIGRQIVQTRWASLTKNLTAAFPELSGHIFNEEAIIIRYKQYEIDYQQVFEEIMTALPADTDRKEVKVSFQTAVGLTMQTELTGWVK